MGLLPFTLRSNGQKVLRECCQKVSLYFSCLCDSHCSERVKSQPLIPK